MTENVASAPESRYLLADLQVHTAHGDGMAHAQDLLDYVERATDLDLIAITDHDDVGGAVLAADLHARGGYSFDLVPGIEVTTRSGHLLALWVTEPIASFHPLEDTIAAIHRAGGLAIIPHPFSMATRSIGQRRLERLLATADVEARPDGIEVSNPTIAGRLTGNRPRQRNREAYGLAETGGSDAHFLEAVGSGVTVFERRPEERSGEALRRALLERRTWGDVRAHPTLRQLGARRLLAQQVIGLSVTPRKVVGPRLRGLAARFGTRTAGR
ncbi:MAG: phosphotransferase [Dehalococcoidia bacterium]|nr:phosphotransferase [Dehalococcoidia bacterium]